MEEILNNFSNNYSSQRAFIKEPMNEETSYSTSNHSFIKSLASNKLISFCIVLSLIVFFGVILAEKNKVFSGLIPTLRGVIILPDNYIVTSIDKKYPILIRRNDPRIGRQLRYKGSVESLFDNVALNLCTRGENVVEIGAHYGYNPIIIGQLLKTNGKYIAIEGNPPVARCLYKNIVLNDLSDTVEVIKIAAADHKGTCDISDDILTNPDEENDGTVITQSLIVECDTLDNILKDKEVSLILIDIPGAVFEALRGAKEIIAKANRLRLLINLDTNKIDKTIDIRRDLESLLRRGMKFYEVVSVNSVREISINEIIRKKKLIVLMKKEK